MVHNEVARRGEQRSQVRVAIPPLPCPATSAIWQIDGVPDRRIRQVADVPAGRVVDDRCMNDLSRALSNPTLHDENGAVSWPNGLPTGAVTLLMTDIEGSTPMWDSDSDRAAAAVVCCG